MAYKILGKPLKEGMYYINPSKDIFKYSKQNFINLRTNTKVKENRIYHRLLPYWLQQGDEFRFMFRLEVFKVNSIFYSKVVGSYFMRYVDISTSLAYEIKLDKNNTQLIHL